MMYKLMVLTIHCNFWGVCDLDVVKELMTFDTQKQCEKVITEIHKTEPGSTLFCVKSENFGTK